MAQLRDLRELATEVRPPGVEVAASSAPMDLLFYEGLPFHGRPTRIFAYLARPLRGTGPLPGVVLVHGGGGRAFPDWATLWAQRGYVALAMDLGGCGPDGLRHDQAGPAQDDAGVFAGVAHGVDQAWMYHAVAAVLRGVSVLADQPEVDPARIGMTGISWGAHVAELAMSLDPRPRAAAFVYGCGFIRDNPVWKPALDSLSPELASRWVDEFDASRHVAAISVPTLWITGTQDEFYSLDRFQDTHSLVGTPLTLRVTPDFPHSHPDGWSPVEISAYFDGYLNGGPPLPTVGAVVRDSGGLTASTAGPLPFVAAQVHSTPDRGPWVGRAWRSEPATLEAGTIRAAAPDDSTAVLLTIQDVRGVVVSTPYVSGPAD
jgi:dienelactone hydrolase